jgi:hypothetical protein
MSAQDGWSQRVRPLAGPTINSAIPINFVLESNGYREELNASYELIMFFSATQPCRAPKEQCDVTHSLRRLSLLWF